MRWRRPLRRLWGATLLLCLCACSPPEPPRPEATTTLPAPDLASVDDALRRQIELLQSALESERGAAGASLAERHGELGNAYHIAELLDAAAGAYGDAQRLAPGDPRWSYYSGLVHDARGDLELAGASFSRTVELTVRDRAARLRLAKDQLRRGAFENAREAFAGLLELDPSSAAAHHGLGRLASIDGEPDTATKHLERALELQPEADSLHYPLAQAYRKLGDGERARHHLERRGDTAIRFPDPLTERLSRTKTLTAFALVEALAGDPEQLSDADFLGFAIEQVGEVDGAAEQLARALEGGPATEPEGGDPVRRDPVWRARMHYAIGGLLARRGADPEAARHLEQALALRPSLRDARLRLANSLARLRRFDDAGAHYSILLESDPDNAGTLLKRATARLQFGRFEAAGDDLERLLALESDNATARLRLAEVLRRTGRSEAAIRELETALAGELPASERPLAHRTAAALHQQSRHDRDALSHLQAATALAPDDADLKRALARLLASSQDDEVRDGDHALALAEALFEAEKNLSNAETMAMALAAAGRFDEAADWQQRLLAEAAKLGHDDHLPRLREALARYRQGKLAPSPAPE